MTASLLRSITATALASTLFGVAAAPSDPGGPPAPRVLSSGGVDYVSSGAGGEARDAISAMQAGFTLKLVFSDSTGAYLVADHVAIQPAAGAPFEVDRAGPWLLVKLPAGRYRMTATYQGHTQQQTADIGATLRTVNWRFPSS